MHENLLVQKVHNEFKRIRYDLSSFFGNYNKELIRFQFAETSDNDQFRVKFSLTQKSLKFIIPKTPDKILVQQLEKTDDIIRDIDQIHKVVSEMSVDHDDQHFVEKMSYLFLWGIQKNKERKQRFYRAKAKKLPFWEENSTPNLQNDVLYYDIIKDFTIVSTDGEGFSEVKLELVFSGEYFITCQNYYLENIRPNRFLILNWLERYSILTFITAKHHLVFETEDYQEISLFLKNQRKHYDEEESD